MHLLKKKVIIHIKKIIALAAVLLIFLSATAQNVDYGKSYINITKVNTGGTIEAGDELEIRATFVVRNTGTTVYRCSFSDQIPLNTTYVPNTLRILTNEGKIYRQFTDAVDTDPASITGDNITINMGPNATAANGGTISNTTRPSFWSNTCIMVASYRVTVNAVPYGTLLPLGSGSISYRTGSNNGPLNTVNFPAVNAIVYQNYGICANTVGTNSILSEFGGTFGDGNTKDRVASDKVPSNYTYIPFGTNAPQDYYYGVSNNTSTGTGAANYSINPAEPYGARRVHQVWDIIGDHTGAANPLLGNPPTDVNNNQTGGYMVVINAAYRTDTAFLDTIRNLCPNTYYEYSAWFRNVCPRCGCDSTGKGPTSNGYIPTALNDSSGVRPTLTFNVNGYDYYSTGDIHYTGQWVKKGFTYRTGPTQTEMIINIRNNAPGGGGNDWAIDDIAVATCLPNMTYSPSLTPSVCEGNALTIYDTIRSYFDNYSHFQWQRSIDNGVSWIDIGIPAVASPVLNANNEYEYVTSHTIPPEDATVSDSGNLYRVLVATTEENLSNDDCQVTDDISIITLTVRDCTPTLGTDIISFQANRNNAGVVQLFWKTSKEDLPLSYIIEKSMDGVSYMAVSTVKGHNNSFNQVNVYHFTDTEITSSKVYYRLVMTTTTSSKKKYSKTVVLSHSSHSVFTISSLVNPFSNSLDFEVSSPDNGKLETQLFDLSGKVVKKNVHLIYSGTNALRIEGTETLLPGSYILKAYYKGEVISRKVLKNRR